MLYCCYCVVLLVIVVVNCVATDSPYDYRIIPYADLVQHPDVTVYSHPDVSHYAILKLDIPRQQLLVGAKNHLISLNLEDLRERSLVSWRPSPNTLRKCLEKGQLEADCNNYVKVLLVNKNQVFTCGTNAFSPNCTWRPASDLMTVTSSITGKAKCPYSHRDNNTYTMTADGSLYSGTVVDYNGRDPVLYRLMGESRQLRTMQYNPKWLNEPNFVSSYEIGDYIYFFFRETAVEYVNCGKNVYSRVARVCKGDSGGNFLLEDNWTTFLKARLNCSIPGQFPFYFNELQSTYFDHANGLVYAVFSTPANSMAGSAVCAYKMSAFQQAFQGPFKHQENIMSAWKRVPNVSPNAQCPGSTKRAAYQMHVPAHQQLLDAQRYQIMDEAVQPINNQPFSYESTQRWTHIQVTQVTAKHHRTFPVMFIATLEGAIKKYIRLGTNKTCLVEEVQVVPKNKPQPIKTLVLHEDKGVLFVGTENSIVKVPVQRCGRFTSRLHCEQAMDPYCGWNSRIKECTLKPDGPSHHWHQDIKACPNLSFPVDGAWSLWSKWGLCPQEGNKDGVNHCKCRHRTCSNPQPQAGGAPCEGEPIQVTNCTTHGAWSSWSKWSSCSRTCGVGKKFRTRQCTNPPPQYGGRLCSGESVEEQLCDTDTLCPGEMGPSRDGIWQNWEDWSGCSVSCGHGIQTRRRHCSDSGGRPCVGNDNEWRQCNSLECPVESKRSRWTPWRVLNVTSEKIYQQRFRFTCSYRQGVLEMSRPDPQTRRCQSSKCGTQGGPSVPDIDGRWSQWTDWTVCNAPCGTGKQQRRRYCNSPRPSGNGQDCNGHGVEIRECNVHSCQGEWSCWTDFSQCSKTCGVGFHYRQRHCRASIPGKLYTRECVGNAYEKQNCQLTQCPDNNGWGPWTKWSLCASDNTQQRKRSCDLAFPRDDQCKGPTVETRKCLQANELLEPAASTGHVGPEYKLLHIIIVGIVAFVLGALIAIGIVIYCQRRREENRQNDPLYASLSKHKAQPNLYVSPSELNMSVQLNRMNSNVTPSKYYSTGSLSRHPKDNQKLTVREATLKRNSLMRTDLSLNEL